MCRLLRDNTFLLFLPVVSLKKVNGLEIGYGFPFISVTGVWLCEPHNDNKKMTTPTTTTTAVSSVSGLEVQHLLVKLNRVAPFLPWSLPEDVELLDLSPPSCPSDKKNNPPKHLQQARSMVRHMDCFWNTRDEDDDETKEDDNDDDDDDETEIVVVEFGCGTAKLSEQVHLYHQQQQQQKTTRKKRKRRMRFVLMDRQDRFAHQHTRVRDRAIRQNNTTTTTTTTPVQRITQDIQELTSLHQRLQEEQEASNTTTTTTTKKTKTNNNNDNNNSNGRVLVVVAIAKHLCGPATDYACRSLQHGERIAIAPCCRYLCQWESTNPSFFTKLGFTQRDFAVCVIVSQWATMKQPKTKKKINLPKEQEQQHLHCGKEGDATPVRPPPPPPWPRLPELPPTPLSSSSLDDNDSCFFVDSKTFESTFSRSDKIALGQRCKLLIDTARAYRLQDRGYTVRLVRYTTLSLEDYLLLATPLLP